MPQPTARPQLTAVHVGAHATVTIGQKNTFTILGSGFMPHSCTVTIKDSAGNIYDGVLTPLPGSTATSLTVQSNVTAPPPPPNRRPRPRSAYGVILTVTVTNNPTGQSTDTTTSQTTAVPVSIID